MSRTFDPSRLALVSPTKVGEASMAVLSKLQQRTPEHQVGSIAVLMLLLCRKYQVHPGNVLEVANNILERTTEAAPGINAAILYVGGEL